MILIVDASVAVKWFFPEPGREAARALEHVDRKLVAPDILLTEVANATWRKHRLGECTRGQATEIARQLPDFFDLLEPSTGLLQHALSIAMVLDHPVYDCFYLACAEKLHSPVLTADRRLTEVAAKSSYADMVHRLGDPLPPNAD